MNEKDDKATAMLAMMGTLGLTPQNLIDAGARAQVRTETVGEFAVRQLAVLKTTQFGTYQGYNAALRGFVFGDLGICGCECDQCLASGG